MSARFYRNPYGAGLCERSALSGSWRRSAPERRPRGPAERGSGSGGDASTAPQVCWGAGIPLRGRIFLSEDTAPPCAVAPFASPPFAHSIPQSHRRASGDLFSASLDKRPAPLHSQELYFFMRRIA